MDALIPFVIVSTIVAGTISLAIWFGIKTGRRAQAHCQALAAELDLACEVRPGPLGLRGWPRVHGTWQGHFVEFYHYSTGSRKNRVQWAAVRAPPAHAPREFKLELAPQGFAAKVREFFGTREVVTGDPAFDTAYFVVTNQPDFLRAALVPELREKLTAAAQLPPRGSFSWTEGAVRFAVRGHAGNARVLATLQAHLPLVCELADLSEVAAQQGY